MLNRKTPPSFKQNKSFELLKPEIQTLSNRSKLYFINGGEQDVLKLELVFNAGKWFECSPGISHFTSILLSKGTPEHDSYQITNKLEYYGVHLEIHPGFDFTSITLYGLPKNIIHVLDLLLDIISNAVFPENELRIAADIYKQGLKINLEKTNFLATRRFRNYLFGNLHPYGYDIENRNIDSIEQQQLAKFRDDYFGEFSGFVSGKISEEIKKNIIYKLSLLTFCKSKSIEHSKSPLTPGDYHTAKEISIQTSIRIGKPTINRSHPDYPGLLLLNHLLGGFFGSRLMKNIREEKGLTYGIHSSIHPLKHESYIVIGADVNKENREVVITEIRAELTQLRNFLIPDKEIEISKNHLIGSLQTELSTPFAHADRIKLIGLFDLPSNYYQNLIDQLFGITETTLNQVANRHLSNENLYNISVG